MTDTSQPLVEIRSAKCSECEVPIRHYRVGRKFRLLPFVVSREEARRCAETPHFVGGCRGQVLIEVVPA